MSRATATVLGWCESITVRLAYYADRLDTHVQQKAGAARWRAGSGRTPTKAEMRRLRALTEPPPLVITEEPSPAASPDPQMVEFFRRMKGQVQ